jgi:predicted HTH domain antitoxin
MNLTLTIPETIFEQSGDQIARELLERAALEAFRTGPISLGRLAEILDLTIDEANGFLKTHHGSF